MTEQEIKSILLNFQSDWNTFFSRKVPALPRSICNVTSEGCIPYAGELRPWYKVSYYPLPNRTPHTFKFFIHTKITDVWDINECKWIDHAAKLPDTLDEIIRVKLRLFFLFWIAYTRLRTAIETVDNLLLEIEKVENEGNMPIVQVFLEHGYLRYEVC